jgi:hypothetical protein
LVKRCEFQKFPTTYADLDEQKGVEFLEGKWGEVTVDRLTVYQNGILLDTRASTAESERILDEALRWAAAEFGVAYRSGMIKRKGYVSGLTFYSEVPLLNRLNPSLSRLSERVGNAAGQIVGKPLSFEPIALSIHHDWLPVGRQPIAPFTISRRAETPFSESKYYSEAPLPTDLHLSLLEEFEKDLA